MSFVADLKRRKVFRVAAVYAVVAWLVIQVVAAVNEPLNLPDRLDTIIIVLLAVGFPVAIIFAWVFDVTRDGLRVTEEAEESDRESRPPTNSSTFALQLLVLVAVGFLVTDALFRDVPTASGFGAARSEPATGHVTRFDFALPSTQRSFLEYWRSAVSVAPDGSYFVYNTAAGIFLRRMNSLRPTLLVAADQSVNSPVTSTDGREIAYWDGESEQLKRIALTGGAPRVIASDVDSPYGVSWAHDDTIWFAQREGVFRVHANGEAPAELIFRTNDGRQVYGPELLPDGDSVIFSLAVPGDWDSGEILAYSISSGELRRIISGGTSARYLPTGHLVYALEDQLFGVRFDLGSLEISGRVVALLDGVMRASAVWQTGVAQYDVSANGTFVYITSEPEFVRSVVWVDRSGTESALPIAPRRFSTPRISPDGTRLVVVEDTTLWIWEFQSETMRTLSLGRNGGDSPVWTPDGARIAYHPGFGPIVDWQAANNVGVPERLATGGEGALDPFHPEDFSPSGDWLVIGGRATSASNWDLGLIAVESGEATWLLGGPGDEMAADLSPNGRWLAYQSDETGRFEIYVRPFPSIDGGLTLISNRGGTQPLWSPDGRKLFYLEPGAPQRMIEVDVETSADAFSFGAREYLMDWPYLEQILEREYDMSPDGERFIAVKPLQDEGVTPKVVIVQNWFEELAQNMSSN